ncbi:MAG: phage portal protein [Patescibacteria group bacterium]
MSLLSRIRHAFGALTKSAPTNVFNSIFDSTSNPSADIEGWQYKASKLLGEEIGAMALRLYRVARDGSWDEVTGESDILSLLESPNADMTRSELFEATSMHLDFYGNAYWFLEGVKDERGKPKAIYLLNPKHVRVEKTGSFPQKVKQYTYSLGGKEYKFEPFQILQFRETNPSDSLIGMGPIQAVADTVELDQEARTWNKSFFKNSARPDLVLKSNFRTREQMEPMRAQFEDKYRGSKNAHRVAVLPEGVVPEKMSWSQKEMDFVEQLRWTRDDILSGLRTPHVVLGLGAGENLNRATAEATNYIYALRTVCPRMKRIVLFLNTRLLSRFDGDLVLDFDNPVPQNEELEMKKRQAALGNQPYMTVNEVRDTLGLQPIDGGDKIATVTNFGAGGTAPAKRLQIKTMPTRIRTFHKKEGAKEEEADLLAGKIADKLKMAMEASTQKADDGEEGWNAFVARVTPFETKAKEAMADYGFAMGDRAVAALEKQTKAINADDLINFEDEITFIIDAMAPVMRELAEAEGTTVAEIVGGAFDAQSDRLEKAVNDAIELMAQNYNQTTVEALKREILEGEEAGEGIDQLKKRIQDIAEFSSTVRADMVARTESYRIANIAGREAYLQTGIKEMVWYTALDEKVCEFCAPQHGKVVATDANFFTKGDVITGSNGETMTVEYSDIYGGALHVNCRCQVRPNVNFGD